MTATVGRWVIGCSTSRNEIQSIYSRLSRLVKLTNALSCASARSSGRYGETKVAALGRDVPTIVTFLVLFYRLQPHFLVLNQTRLGLATAGGPIGAGEWLLDPQGKPPSPSGDVLFSKLHGPVIFENVSFTYANRPKSGDALRNLNFAIGPGRVTALIGRSGAGKSTIVSLLCRLLEPTSGRITVNGVDLSQIDPETWCRHIGVAGQDLELVDGTIADNIARSARCVRKGNF